MGILFVVLCGLSFYLGGIFCSEKNKFFTEKIAKTVDSLGLEQSVSGPIQVKSISFPECSVDLQDYAPCTDPKRWMKYGWHRLIFMERHCPPVFDRKECLISPPDGYKEPAKEQRRMLV